MTSCQLVDCVSSLSARVGEVDRLHHLNPPLSALGVESRKKVGGGLSSLSIGSGLTVLMQERVTLFIPAAWGVVVSAATWDVLFGSTEQELAACHVGFINVVGSGRGNTVSFFVDFSSKSCHFALQKFRLQVDFPTFTWIRDGTVISNRQCWE